MSGEIDYYALGMRIRSAREKRGLTQERLAELCSLSAAHIGHTERGTRTPSLETVYKIACALEVSVDSLLLDSFTDEQFFTHLSAVMKNKDKKKVSRFVTMVGALAEKLDEL